MGKPLKWTTEQKLPLVLSVLRGEGSVAEIGRRHGVSDVTLAKWRDAFLAGGAAALAVARFCALLGIPRATWYRWKRAACSRPGRWPAPVVDALEPIAASYATTFAAWGHRKLWALLQADGYQVSMSSVARALARRGLLLPLRYQAERRQLARARRAVFLEPPTRRCRVWQSDFS